MSRTNCWDLMLHQQTHRVCCEIQWTSYGACTCPKLQDMCSLTSRAPWNKMFPYNPQPAGQTNHDLWSLSASACIRHSASVANLGTVLTAEVDVQKAAGNTVMIGLDMDCFSLLDNVMVVCQKMPEGALLLALSLSVCAPIHTMLSLIFCSCWVWAWALQTLSILGRYDPTQQTTETWYASNNL